MFVRSSLQDGLPYSLPFATVLTILLALALASSPLHAQGVGYWHTSGSKIVDAQDKTVRIAGVNWYGFETKDEVAHGLYSQDYHAILNTIAARGYNTIRLPFSNQMIETPIVPTPISFSNGSGAINTDLKGLNSLAVMDKVIAAAGKLGLKVILDNHRSEAGNDNESNGLWYTSAYPESKWIADWKTLAARYKSYTDSDGNPTVIGVDLRNEPHLIATNGMTGSCWTGDSTSKGCPATNAAQNWPAAAERGANAVLGVNSGLLIFIEGTDCYSNDCGWQGANLEGAGKYPVTLSIADRVVYSAHDYGPDVYVQSWFSSKTTAASLTTTWTKYWGYLSADGTAPVWVGEFGTTNTSGDVESNTAGSQGQWFHSLINYFANSPNIQWTYWALNGEDKFGLLDANYDEVPVSSLKQQLLESIQFPLHGDGEKPCEAAPGTPAGATATAASASAITVVWGAVTPPAGCSVTYNVYRSTASSFSAASSNQVASGLTAVKFADSGLSAATHYYYRVRAEDIFGNSAVSAVVSAATEANPVKPAPVTPAVSCHVAYTISNQWNGGFQAAITVTNTGSTKIASWTLKWSFGGKQQLSSAWNATASQSGEAITMQSMSYNGAIAPGGSVTGIGFTANFSGTNSVPAAFTLNGTACK